MYACDSLLCCALFSSARELPTACLCKFLKPGCTFESYKNALRGANFALIQNLKRMFLENLFWFGGFKVVLCSQSRKKSSTWNKKGLIWSCAETTNRSATALSHKQFDLKMYKQQPTDPHLHDCIDSQMLWFKNTLIHQPTNLQIRQRLQ